MRRICNLLVVVVIVLIGGGLLLTFGVRTRDAEARERCRNNLRQIGLSLDNYHTIYERFPSGTKPKENIGVEKRLSWLFEILPYIEARMDPGWQHVDWNGTWDSNEHRTTVELPCRTYLCPSNPNQGAANAPALTHYVGIAGIGADAASLSRDDRRAGVFGYENTPAEPHWRGLGVRRADIKDGLTKTMMVVETTWENGPWAAGGPSTVRGLDPDRQPYLGAGNQFGGLHRRGSGLFWFTDHSVTNVLFTDASVRSITDSLDPRLFEALATIAGGEDVGMIGDE